MASVTGKTSLKIDDLINDTIVDGEMVGGHLLLRSRGGAEIDAGVIVGVTSILDVMPIGFVYISVSPTSPATLFGAGTWVRIAQGRVLVGQDPAQTEFDVVEETGGEKVHVLTTGEMAAHTHTLDHNHAAFNTAGGEGNHTHTIPRKTAAGTDTGVVRGGVTVTADGTTNAGGNHLHAIDVPAFTGASSSVGSGTAHNNLQPYLVVYMWKRTA